MNFTEVIIRLIKRLNQSEIGFLRGLQTLIYSALSRNSGFPRGGVTKGNGFLLEGCPDWELHSTILLEMTDLLDDISVY